MTLARSLRGHFASRLRFRGNIDRPDNTESEVKASSLTWATYGLVAVMGLVFAIVWAESGIRYDLFESSVGSLGMLIKPMVLQHQQYWRVITAPFLHAGLLHLAVNTLSLLALGKRLERVSGPVTVLMLFLTSALGGSILSTIFGPLSIPSVGSSGGVCGLLAAESVYSHVHEKLNWRSLAMTFLLNGVLAFLFRSKLDNFAHLGGFLTGLAFAMVLWGVWRKHTTLAK